MCVCVCVCMYVRACFCSLKCVILIQQKEKKWGWCCCEHTEIKIDCLKFKAQNVCVFASSITLTTTKVNSTNLNPIFLHKFLCFFF